MGIVFTHGIQMGGWFSEQLSGWGGGRKNLSGLYLRNHEVYKMLILGRDIGWGRGVKVCNVMV